MHTSPKMLARLVIVIFCILLGHVRAFAQGGEVREWADVTGQHKVVGTLQEVKDGVAIIKSKDGKTIRVPVNKLSKADQEFLEGGGSPFEVVESDDSTMKSNPPAAKTGSTTKTKPSSETTTPASVDWTSPVTVDWDNVEEFHSMAGVEWKVPATETAGLGFEPKRAALAKKANFFENMHPLAVNPICKRAAVGYSVTFSIPKPLTRLSLVDLVAGKAVNTEAVEAHMRPLTLLNDGTSILMVGASDERGGFETPDQLQIWKLSGKKLVRSASWIPYPMEKEEWGKQQNAGVVWAAALGDDKLFTVSDKGHLALWNLAERTPIWHGRLGGNFAVEESVDRSMLAVFDEKVIMVVKAEDGEILGSASLDPSTHVAWPRIAWSPSGKRIAVSFTSTVRILDVEKGEWTLEYSSTGGPVCSNALSYPHDDYLLLDNHLLVHLPSRIQVCDYRGAGPIKTVGGTSFIGMLEDSGGLLAPGKFPHPAAEKILETAQKDPAVFLVHPGVGVAVDVAGVSPQYQQVVRQGLEKAAVASGYKVEPSAPIVLVASITGPKQETVSYIASGSYVVNAYTSTIKVIWNGRELWQTGGTNVPGVLMTKDGQTIEQALAEAGQSPNLAVFEGVRFPQYMQKPSEKSPGPGSSSLMTSQFTMQGLVDDK